MKKLLIILLLTPYVLFSQTKYEDSLAVRKGISSLASGENLKLRGATTGEVEILDSLTTPFITINEVSFDGTDGTNGQALTTNGSGTVSFSDISGFTVTNEADNRVITSTGAGTGNAEANMTFDGSTLTLAADLDFSGANHNITNMGDVSFQTGATGGTISTGTSNADKWALRAYDVDGAAYQTVASAHAGNTVLFHLFSGALRMTDENDNTKRASFDLSGITTGTTRSFTFPDQAGTFALTENIGTTIQAWDAQLDDISGLAVTDGNIIVGNGANWVAESGATARASLGLGTIATQNANSVNIDGGTIDGTIIGGTTAAAGSFTTVSSSGSDGNEWTTTLGSNGFHYAVTSDVYGTANSSYRGRRARGTESTPTAVQSGDYFNSITGSGYDGSGFSASSNVAIIFRANGNFSGTSYPTSILFQTTRTNETAKRTVAEIDQAGTFKIGFNGSGNDAILHFIEGNDGWNIRHQGSDNTLKFAPTLGGSDLMSLGSTGNLNLTGSLTSTALTGTGDDIVYATSGGALTRSTVDINDISTGGIQTSEVTISSANFLNINSSPVTIVSAPGAGNYIVIMAFAASMDYNSTTYSCSGNLRLEYATSGVGTEVPASTYCSGSDQAAMNVVQQASGLAIGINQALVAKTASSDPTTGNSPIKIKVWYTIESI